MPRFQIALIVVVLTAAASAHAQESRYVPIEFHGNFERLFQDRLEQLKDQPLRDFLDQIPRTMKWPDFNPSPLKPLIERDPAFRDLLKKLRATQVQKSEFNQEDIQTL